MNDIIKQETLSVQDAQGVRSPEIIAAEINYIKRQTQEVVIANAIEVGRRLTEAKEMVHHGQWEQWLQDNVNYSQSTANNLMAIYREYGSDQQSLFSRVNTSVESLSYSKAVALLVLPREQREEFMEQNPVEDMSTRELQAAIKRAQEAEKQMGIAIEERQKYQKQIGDEMARANKLTLENLDLNEQVKRMEERVASAKKLVEEWEKEKQAKQKAEDKAKKLQKKIKELEEKQNQPDQQTLDRLAAEAVEKVKAENRQELEELKQELEEAQQEKDRISKRLELVNEEMNEARFLIKQIQSLFNSLMGLISLLKNKGDTENADKLRRAVGNLCKKILEKVGE